MGTENNYLNETVLLSTQNTCLNQLIRGKITIKHSYILFNRTYDDSLNVFIAAYEYVADTEEASDSVASSFEGLSPRVADDSERAQMLREMQEMQERIHSVFSGKLLYSTQ